ncbi:MAG: hypothetical protein U5L96_17260 [Owenweeksia sp.]|nr:hypothetical protein [Owenweeksia sp.]
MRQVLRLPQVWWLAGIILCSYMLYVGTFDFPAYAERSYGQSKTFGAVLGTIRDWMRPIAAIGAGLMADRFSSTRTILGSFLLLVVSYLTMGLLYPGENRLWILWLQVLVAALAAFSLRGVYFAVLKKQVPYPMTGIAVGIVSFIRTLRPIFFPMLFPVGLWIIIPIARAIVTSSSCLPE